MRRFTHMEPKRDADKASLYSLQDDRATSALGTPRSTISRASSMLASFIAVAPPGIRCAFRSLNLLGLALSHERLIKLRNAAPDAEHQRGHRVTLRRVGLRLSEETH